ncbi:unnamed protein product [Caenorhabditis angaria]|uniref:Uncharacterized protein n=1 Tax=Caenorhabditis angaria TaxID=860376 RepID=A0A9P1IM62_9PELO|nr:unnamed protein product [Caenorhabditis angaria]
MKFPKNFKFATATAAYQIEGARLLDGRGRSTWDEIREQPGRIADNSNIDLSCEGRLKFREDVELLKEIGVTTYRFSVSWSRILPNGDISKVNQDAIDYYRELCHLLVDANIEPIITLFHADMPLQVFDSGSWLNWKNCQHFIDFSEVCFKNFGDLVKTWITFNEINMQAWCGLVKFKGQPWHCPDRPEPENKKEIPYLAASNMLLAHAEIYHLYQRIYKKLQNGKIGIVNGGRFSFPATESEEDIEARNRAIDWLFNYTIEPIFGDGWPKRMEKMNLMKFSDEQKMKIKGSADFLGINYYVSHKVKKLEKLENAPSQCEADGDFDFAEDDWEKICGETWVKYVPEGLYELLKYVKNKYGDVPIWITENGCMDIDGDPLEDNHRVRYIQGHLEAVSKALVNGCNVIGYTVWSLMDNFEWDDGFAVRFGICRIDFENDPKKEKSSQKICEIL